MKRLSLADAISLYRIFAAPILILVSVLGYREAFIVLFIVSIVTDLLDGVLADPLGDLDALAAAGGIEDLELHLLLDVDLGGLLARAEVDAAVHDEERAFVRVDAAGRRSGAHCHDDVVLGRGRLVPAWLMILV